MLGRRDHFCCFFLYSADDWVGLRAGSQEGAKVAQRLQDPAVRVLLLGGLPLSICRRTSTSFSGQPVIGDAS